MPCRFRTLAFEGKGTFERCGNCKEELGHVRVGVCGPFEAMSTSEGDLSESVTLKFRHGSTCTKWSGKQRVCVGVCETDAKERSVLGNEDLGQPA